MTKPQNEKAIVGCEECGQRFTPTKETVCDSCFSRFQDERRDAYQTLSRELDEAKRMIATREMSLEILNESLAEKEELFTQAHSLLKSRDEQINELQYHLDVCVEKIQSSKNVMDQCLAYIAKDDSAQAKYLWEMIQRYLYDRE